MVKNSEILDEICDLYCKVAKKCHIDDTPISDSQKEWAVQIFQDCIVLYMRDAKDLDEARCEIEELIDESAYRKEIRRIVSIEAAYKEAKIRRDFAKALQRVKYGSALSQPLGYRFSHADLKNLATLHRTNRFREKIEDLLTDCNFHEECALMHSGNYSAWLD